MTTPLHTTLAAFDATLPLERAHTIPNTWYFDPEVAAAEQRHLFGNTWQMVGRLDQVAQPGSFFTANLAGEPILVTRDQEGVLRAFYNVCRHRAAQVINEPQGTVSKLRCRYHGWTYDLAGRLRGTPEFDGVQDFCKESQGLVEVLLDTWGPLVWVHLGGRPAAPSLAEYLAPLPARAASLGLERLQFVERREYILQCNWKVFVDNYLDGGYHVNTVHPSLASVLDYAEYRTETFRLTSVQSSPLRPPDATREDASAGNVRVGDRAYYWCVFPNFMMNIYQGVMDTNLVLPLGPERCRVLFDFYFADTAAKEFNAQSIAVGHQVQLEDVGICEEVQRGLASRSYTTGRFSVKRERAGYHFHQLLAEWLRNSP